MIEEQPEDFTTSDSLEDTPIVMSEDLQQWVDSIEGAEEIGCALHPARSSPDVCHHGGGSGYFRVNGQAAVKSQD